MSRLSISSSLSEEQQSLIYVCDRRIPGLERYLFLSRVQNTDHDHTAELEGALTLHQMNQAVGSHQQNQRYGNISIRTKNLGISACGPGLLGQFKVLNQPVGT